MKNKNAVNLGKLGGKARAERLSPERRREIAQMGGLAKKRKAVDNSLDAKNEDI